MEWQNSLYEGGRLSMYRQAFTNAQEKALIQVINWLTDYNIPQITAIIKNLVEEIRELW